MKNKPFSLNSCNPKEEKSDIWGLFSRFLIPKIELLRANLLSLWLIGFSCISFIYGLFGNHPHIFPLSILSAISFFAIMSEEYVFRICQNCGKELAYVMIWKTEIINKECTEKKVTSYYRCKYCGHERVRVEIFDLGCGML